MSSLTFTEAFRAYGAKLANPMWAYSAVADDGSIVISCWSHKLKLNDGILSYADRLSRWRPNTPGKHLLVEHLTKGRDLELPVMLVVTTTNQPEVVERGEDASEIQKTFHIKPDVIGKVTRFDGDNFVLEFRRK